MPASGIQQIAHRDVLSYEEMLDLVKLLAQMGISKVRVTGGEPLVRRGVEFFLQELSKIELIKEKAITTNGVLLREKLEVIKNSGIQAVNISLDSLREDRYKSITGVDGVKKVLEGIDILLTEKDINLKINVVLIKGTNDDEVYDFINLAQDKGLEVRFIERMPAGEQKEFDIISNEGLRELISKKYPLKEIVSSLTAKRYRISEGEGIVGFISPYTDKFCYQCNRLRLSCDGKLRFCLLSKDSLDLRRMVRSGSSEEEIKKEILKFVSLKEEKSALALVNKTEHTICMHGVGG